MEAAHTWVFVHKLGGMKGGSFVFENVSLMMLPVDILNESHASTNTEFIWWSEKKLPPFIPPNLWTNTQVCAASIQLSSWSKAEEINNISLQTVVTIKLRVTRTDDPMFLFWAKGTQTLLIKFILQDAAYEAVRKITLIPIQYMKKEWISILNQKKVIFVNYETSMSNPYYSLGIYLTADKVAQCTLVADNRREKEERKRKQQIRHSPKICILKRSDVKLFRNARIPWIFYCCIPPKNQCSSIL